MTTETQSTPAESTSLAEFKQVVGTLRREDLEGLATSLFIQTRILDKYAPMMIDTANRELAPAVAVGNRVVGSTIPRTEEQQVAAQFFADNPSAAAVAFKWYFDRKSG